MTNSIVDAISVALFNEFGYKNHMEEIKKIEEPCFFIKSLNPERNLFRGKRYFCRNPFCIQYFPATKEKQRECNEVAERMTWALETITADGDLYRGTGMNSEVVDGVLNFFVNYDTFAYKVENVDAMEVMEADTITPQ